MNTENSITPEQISAIFRTHNLANTPSITRITTGFTNEVYVVDDYILKVCVDTHNEPNFEREIFLYQALRGLVKIPEPIVADTSKILLSKFYMIYQKIEGDPVGRRWHLLKDAQRRELVEDLCQQLRRMDDFPMEEYRHRFGLNPHLGWQEVMVSSLFQALATVREKEILSGATLQAIEKYIRENAYVLEEQKLGLVFWDVQLDNMLINSQNKLAALIDFEGVSITSIDFRLVIIRMMAEHPHRFMSEEMEPYARAEDYKALMAWYQEFYPELFDFPDLDKRLDLYELGDILHHLPAWPKTKLSHDRLAKILNS
jgi:aminoglycoside phosphotransferase (APT) family kinase protein